ncbi:MAG: heme oxygenase (biliverdin-producing) [Micrococcaceae bacterium]
MTRQSRLEHPESLSVRVRTMTAEDHKSAETASFITELMSGKRSVRDYALLVSQYFYIYNALDEASEQLRGTTGVPGVAELLDPRLDRRAAIRADLDSLLPAVGLDLAPVELSSTADYAERLREVANDPARLAAHHYLRYLGDLSGGLAIARLVQRHYEVSDDQLNMYTFASIDKPKLYKDAYRDQLDALGFTPEQQDDFIAEANRGFAYNKSVFVELGSYSDSLAPAGV